MKTSSKRRATAAGILVGTRFQPDLLAALDSWRKGQVDLPTRPEAVRRLVELGMASNEAERGKRSPVERGMVLDGDV